MRTLSPFRLHHRQADSQVHVRNDRFEDLTVYLQREGGTFRLGVVPGKGSSELTIPADYARLNSWVRLVARTTGREPAAYSEVFGVGMGSDVTWAVPLTTGETPVLIKELR
jgi:hypothetical protein